MWFLKSDKQENYSDAELLEKYKSSGKSHYVSELFQRYTHLMFGVCMKYLKNEEDSKDAVMEIFEHLLEVLKTQEVTNFKAWLYSVAKNHCLFQLRKQKKLDKKQEVFEKDFQKFMEFDQNVHLLNGNDENEPMNIQETLNQLCVEQRQCVELFYLQSKSYKEVSDVTGYSLLEVKSHLQNGKRNLKNHLTNKVHD